MKGRKGSVDEGGVRSTCFLRWPRNCQPITRDANHRAIDLLPTLLSLTGIRVSVTSRSMAAISRHCCSSNQANGRTVFSFRRGRAMSACAHNAFVWITRGNLYDMLADPGQTTPVNNQHPDAGKEFKDEIAQWKRDVLASKRPADETADTKGAKKKAGGANAVDPRPIPVGYREFPITMLPARDGEPRGGRPSQQPRAELFLLRQLDLEGRQHGLAARCPHDRQNEVMIDYTSPAESVGAQID